MFTINNIVFWKAQSILSNYFFLYKIRNYVEKFSFYALIYIAHRIKILIIIFLNLNVSKI